MAEISPLMDRIDPYSQKFLPYFPMVKIDASNWCPISFKKPAERGAGLAPSPEVAPKRSNAPGGLANGSAGLFPPPALGERRHRSLARRLIAVRRCPAL